MAKYPNTSPVTGFKPLGCALRAAFRGPTRVHEGREIWSLAVVTKVSAKYVELVTHNLFCVEVLQLNHDDFCKLYHPLPTTGRKAAAAMLQLCQTLTVVPPAQSQLEVVLLSPEEVKLPRDKTKTVKKAATTASGFTVYGPGPRGKDHTCIVLERDTDWVTYISMYDGMTMGLNVAKSHTQEFDQWYVPTTTYPIEKLASLYMEYALHVGATPEALDVLGKIIHISDKEYEMATAKKAAGDAAKTTKTPAKAAEKPAAAAKETKATKPAAEKPAKEAKAPAKAAASKPAEKPAKEAKASGDKKPSAAQRFQELIMEGKKTDDEIFAIVQKEFNLDDSKKSYVKWYRNHLTKQGKNPPAAKTK